MCVVRYLFCFTLLIFLENMLYGESVYSLANITQQKSGNTTNFTFIKLGNQISAEFNGCTNLNNCNGLEKALREAAHAACATVLSVTMHQFEPFGVTGAVIGVAVLQESHIFVHTWPENGYAAINIFTCGKHVSIYNAFEVLRKFFAPDNTSKICIDRGFVE